MDVLTRGWIPDPLLRAGIRRICGQRLRRQARLGGDPLAEHVALLRRSPIAVATHQANDQHYEVPPAFFEAVLGPHLKYSCGHWAPGARTLGDAEAAALALVEERARLEDGQRILELGCGWGALTLWMAERFPASSVTAVSNSAPQRRHIEARAEARGLDNVTVITADVNDFAPPLDDGPYDRVVSVEMFEHMRNWERLLGRVARWLAPDGLLFLHVFSHREHAYLYEDRGPSDWMAREFFSGGQMPAHDLILAFQDDLSLVERWRLNGEHYAKTSDAWLANLDARRDDVLALFRADHGAEGARRQLHRWRIFFMACAELFRYRAGSEWGVSHWLLAPKAATA